MCETYKNPAKLSFAKDAALNDPSALLKSSLAGTRPAIDFRENERINDNALKAPFMWRRTGNQRHRQIS
jgi:hypothetical protein